MNQHIAYFLPHIGKDWSGIRNKCKKFVTIKRLFIDISVYFSLLGEERLLKYFQSKFLTKIHCVVFLQSCGVSRAP